MALILPESEGRRPSALAASQRDSAPQAPRPPRPPVYGGALYVHRQIPFRRAQPSTQVRRFVLPLVCGHCGRLRLLICACGVHRLIRRRIRHRLGADRAVLAKPPRTFHVKHRGGASGAAQGSPLLNAEAAIQRPVACGCLEGREKASPGPLFARFPVTLALLCCHARIGRAYGSLPSRFPVMLGLDPLRGGFPPTRVKSSRPRPAWVLPLAPVHPPLWVYPRAHTLMNPFPNISLELVTKMKAWGSAVFRYSRSATAWDRDSAVSTTHFGSWE